MILGNTHDETRSLIGGSNPALFSLDWTALPAELEHYRQFLRDLSTEAIIGTNARTLNHPGEFYAAQGFDRL